MGKEQAPSKTLKRGIKAAKYTVLFRLSAQLATLIVTPLLVWALSEYEFGIYSILYSFIGLLSTIASFGIANTLQRYIPDYYSKGEFIIANRLYRLASVVRLLTSSLMLGLFLILWDHLAPILKIQDYKQYFMLFTLVVILHMQKNMLLVCLSSYFLQKYSQGLMLLFVIFRGLGYGVTILLEGNLWFILAADLAAYALVFLLLQLVYSKKIPLKEGNITSFSSLEKKRLVRYAMYYNFNDAGVAFLKPDFDNFVIAAYMNPVAVGAYAFCRRLSMMIRHVLPDRYLLDVIRPLFFSMGMENDTPKINQAFHMLIKINYMFNIPILCFVAIYGTTLIDIFFNGKFREYGLVLTVVYMFIVASSFDFSVNLVAQLKERANIILYSKIFSVYNIIADIVLIRFFGIWGAVFATGTAILGKNLFIWYFNRKEASFSGTQSFFVKLIFYWFVVGIATFYINGIIESDVLKFVIGCFVFGVLFLLQFSLKLFSQNEKTMFDIISNENKKLKKLEFFIR